MKVYMLQWALGAPDRVNMQEFKEGTTPDIPDFLAEIFFQAGYAEDYEQYKYRKRQEASQREIEARRLKEESDRIEARYRRNAGRDYNEYHDHFDVGDTIRVGHLAATIEEKLDLFEDALSSYVNAAQTVSIVRAKKENRFLGL